MDVPASSELSDWQLEFARLIVYPVESPLVNPKQWWQDLAGQPDDFELRETRQSWKVTGSFRGARLSLTVDPNHIVWEVQPAKVEDEVLPGKVEELPTLGPYRDKLYEVVALLTPWFENARPPIRRLAFGGKLLQPAATVQQAFRVLAAHLPWMKLEPLPND